jgi:stress response protein YsnF
LNFQFDLKTCCHLSVFRKRTKKTSVKVGHKKAKTTNEASMPEVPTPRTRAAVAREAAAQAKRDAEVAEMKAAAAREVAQAAARDETLAARALVHLPVTSGPASTNARR